MVVQSASRNALSLSAKASGTQPWQVVSVVSQYVVQYSLNSLQSYNHFERWQSIWAKNVVRLCVGGENMQSAPLTPPLRGDKAPSQPPPKGRGLLRQVTVPTPNPSPSRGGEGRRRGILCFVRPKKLDRILCCCKEKMAMPRGMFSDAPWRIGQLSTLCRCFLHVNFQFSTFNFQLHSLFRLTALCAVLILS